MIYLRVCRNLGPSLQKEISLAECFPEILVLYLYFCIGGEAQGLQQLVIVFRENVPFYKKGITALLEGSGVAKGQRTNQCSFSNCTSKAFYK